MVSQTTIARPYARAAFEYALAAKTLEKWSGFLNRLSEGARAPELLFLLTNPQVTQENLFDLLSHICRKVLHDKAQENFLRLLIVNRRIAISGEIAELFRLLREEQEKRITVKIITAEPLDRKHNKAFTQALSKRLNREVDLVCEEEGSLIGGAIIRAGDKVIDGSIRGKLDRLIHAIQSEG